MPATSTKTSVSEARLSAAPWPAVAASVLAASFELARNRPRPLLLAAALVGPTSTYFALTPLVWGLFPVAAYLVASVAIRRHRGELSAALVAANAAFFGWLALTTFG